MSDLLRALREAPVERSAPEDIYRWTLRGTLLFAAVVLGALALLQPDIRMRTASAAAGVAVVAAASWLLARQRSIESASWVLVVGLVLIVGGVATASGGLESPGVRSYLVLVLVAGVLLGQRAAVGVAALCALISLGLAVASRGGVLPQATPYSPTSLWILLCMYLGVTLVVMHLFSRSVTTMLDRTARALQERAAAAASLGERVKELRLLHDVAQLLSPDVAYEATVLAELAPLIPAAFQHPESTSVRIAFGTESAETTGFGPTARQVEIPLRTTASTGAITVVRLGPTSATGERDFLPEEVQLLRTLAEMIEAYLERDFAHRQRERLEQQLRQAGKMEALGTLAGGIAHDFNNLLASISANVTLLRAAVPAHPEPSDALQEIELAHGRARDLVRRILMFGKLDAPERKAVAIRGLAVEISSLVRSLMPPNVSIELEIPEHIPLILADDVQVHQALLNLVTNAGYAMRNRRGSVRVTARVHEVANALGDTTLGLAPGKYVRVAVADNGPGIDPAILDRLFDPFFTTKGAEGTGLGLAVVFRVMQEHNGSVNVSSTMNEGTEFALYFPAAAANEPVAAAPTSIVRGQGQRVLLVDDETVLCFAIQRLLKSVGFECESFSDPFQAMAAFRANPTRFAVALVDFSMPGLSGTELAEQMTEIRPHFPVILSSGYSGNGWGADVSASIAATVPKPVELPHLTQVIARLLAGRDSNSPSPRVDTH